MLLNRVPLSRQHSGQRLQTRLETGNNFLSRRETILHLCVSAPTAAGSPSRKPRAVADVQCSEDSVRERARERSTSQFCLRHLLEVRCACGRGHCARFSPRCSSDHSRPAVSRGAAAPVPGGEACPGKPTPRSLIISHGCSAESDLLPCSARFAKSL